MIGYKIFLGHTKFWNAITLFPNLTLARDSTIICSLTCVLNFVLNNLENNKFDNENDLLFSNDTGKLGKRNSECY